jgi:type I restriction enzyme S subunit
MSDWVHSNVGAVTLYQRAGGTPTATTDAYYGGEIPFVTIEDITNGTRYLDKTVKNLSELGLRTSAAWLIKEPHILYSMYATVGKPIINRIACATNQAIIALKVSEAVEQDFLFYQLLLIRPQVYKFTSQTTQSNLNASSVRKLPIAYPKSRATQRKIASIISTIDTAIEQTEALIEKYQHIKAGLMHDLFTRGVLPNGQLRPPREQAPELYQETAIGWIPRDWQTDQIGTYFEIQLGKMLNQLARTGRNSFPYLGNRSVQWNRLQMDNLESMDFSPEEQKKFALKDGDLLVCEGGEVGRTAIWASQMENCFYQKAIHRLRGKHEGINPRFMLWYMHFAQANGQFSDFTSQSSIAHLTQEKLAKVPVLLPSAEEQDLIVSRIDAHESVMQGQRDFRVNLNAQKLGLMQDLLTGKVAVTVESQHNAPTHAE